MKPASAMKPAAVIVLALLLAAGHAHAVERCEVNGESVNPNNGNTTKDKTGLMRCREEGTGPVTREQELQQGRFMGVVRRYRDGILERDYRVNERGNRDGLSREYTIVEGKGVLVAEETLANSRRVGIARRWHPNGELRRVSWSGDDEREAAVAEFTADGRLDDLACSSKPVLAPHFDDAKACGFSGDSIVALHAARGAVKARVTWRRGEAVRRESLWESGATRDLQEKSTEGGSTKSFAADGTLRRELQWVPATERQGRITVLEREFHERGTLVHEKRWRAVERGGQLASEQRWYLNGQPKERTDYEATDAQTTKRSETHFHDNGRKSFEGAWLGSGRSSRDRAVGLHRSFDAEGRVRGESSYDERGRITRERVLDERGAVVRDDEVFEDGSRKAVGK